MNIHKKYFFVGGVVVAILVGGVFLSRFVKAPSLPEETSNDPFVVMEVEGSKDTFVQPSSLVLANALVKIPESGAEVQLVDGGATYDDGVSKITVTLGDVFALHKTGKNEYDAFAILSVNYGGSGTFRYVGLFKVRPDTTEHTSSALLGDRIVVDKILIKGKGGEYTISVTGLTRNEYEPLSTPPSLPFTWDFFVSNHTLITG